VRDFQDFAQIVAFFGHLNTLSQTVLKLTSPGVPDFYQGTERVDLSLVDPDNRRPVDYSEASALFDAVQSQRSAVDIDDSPSARKLFVIAKLLELRRTQPRLFAFGSYEPLRVVGDRAEHLCAFARRMEDTFIIVVVPRCTAKLQKGETGMPLGSPVWGDTRVEVGSARLVPLRNVFTSAELSIDVEQAGSLKVSDVLVDFPVAVLTG
jgi:(1->4)-alpha-D-glucan 1-alpha-D-glucosylmutase